MQTGIPHFLCVATLQHCICVYQERSSRISWQLPFTLYCGTCLALSYPFPCFYLFFSSFLSEELFLLLLLFMIHQFYIDRDWNFHHLFFRADLYLAGTCELIQPVYFHAWGWNTLPGSKWKIPHYCYSQLSPPSLRSVCVLTLIPFRYYI